MVLQTTKVKCSKCNAELLEENTFCGKCGNRIKSPIEVSPTRVAVGNPLEVYSECDMAETIYEQQAEDRDFCQTKIQQDLNEALLKRMIISNAAKKKKKRIKILVIVVMITAVLVFAANAIVDNANNSKLRNFATDVMDEDYTNVYADIVSIEPEYFVYTSFDNGPETISSVICKCVTIEGRIIWAEVATNEYPSGSYLLGKYEPYYYDQANPKRIVGRASQSGKIVDGLEQRIGNVMVLRVIGKIEK